MMLDKFVGVAMCTASETKSPSAHPSSRTFPCLPTGTPTVQMAIKTEHEDPPDSVSVLQ
jgi:hypothetical protein